MQEPTAADILRALGYSKRPLGPHRFEVLDQNGEVIWTGRVGEVWDWFRETGRWPLPVNTEAS